MKEPSSAKIAFEQLKTSQIPKKVVQLNNYIVEVKDKGWQAERAITLKDHLAQLHDMVKAIEQPAIETLVNKVDKILGPYLQPPYPSPSEKLALVQAYITKLQEVIALNLIEEQEIIAQEVRSIRHSLLLALNDKQLTDEIIQQVKYFGYHCVVCKDLQELYTTANKPHMIDKCGVIIMDTDYLHPNDVPNLKKISLNIPIIFISGQTDIANRLLAVEAGGQAYFVQPLEFSSLVEKIDSLTSPISEKTPYRILIIEDSKTQATFISKQLEQASMITEILMDPLKINDALMEFQPDLILLDLYMPYCSGIELAKVIRQQDLFVSIPIVYLSAEEDLNKQLDAIKDGGDDFLTKPISPHYLISVVTARAQRSRTLRSEMIEDSLTGLLNHTRCLEQLDLEIARAKRNKTPVCFAMIDIDHFKTINDSHGHPVGDRVIKGLARLLKQRLRKTDSVGRYGGEEFAVILPQTHAIEVVKTLDNIRRGFSKLLHRSSDPLVEFSATFSAGLAEFSEDIDTVDKLVNAADKVLYRAKEEGRNCIKIYT